MLKFMSKIYGLLRCTLHLAMTSLRPSLSLREALASKQSRKLSAFPMLNKYLFKLKIWTHLVLIHGHPREGGDPAKRWALKILERIECKNSVKVLALKKLFCFTLLLDPRLRGDDKWGFNGKHSFLFSMSLVCLFLLFSTAAVALDVKAPQVYLKDFDTGEVLLEKNADEKMVPSSMSKIMTAYLVFDRLKTGDIKLGDTLHVSKEAWKMQGSKMFVQVDTNVSVDDLLSGAIVQSGNDACVVLAEGLGGTESGFAEEMTKKAHEMGAKNSTFLNSTGWPDEGHLTTAKDLSIIAERTIRDFPELYAKYYALTEFTYNDIKQGNRNTLLYKDMGADGMKTGHTDAGGYGIVASAKQGDRRLILVVNGLESSKERDQEATALLNWGFNTFKNYKIFKRGDVVEVADVWSGDQNSVPLVAGQDIVFTVPRSQRNDLQVKVIYDSPIAAPLKAGTEIGTLEVTIPQKGVFKFPLSVGKDIPEAGFFQRINNSVHYLLWGKHS